MNFVPIEAAIHPGGDTDVMMAVVLGMIGLCLEGIAYGKAYQGTMRRLREKTGGRLGNSTYPPNRTQGIVGIVWGVIFLAAGLPVCVWVSMVFGVLWNLCAGFFLVMHVYQTFIKRYGNGENAGDAGRKPDPEVLRQLEQLKSHRDAGLLTDREYREKRDGLMKKQ